MSKLLWIIKSQIHSVSLLIDLTLRLHNLKSCLLTLTAMLGCYKGRDPHFERWLEWVVKTTYCDCITYFKNVITISN